MIQSEIRYQHCFGYIYVTMYDQYSSSRVEAKSPSFLYFVFGLHIDYKVVSVIWTEVGIYRDNLSAIVIGDNFLPIIVIAQDSLDLSITDIAFVIYFVIADKLSR